MIWAAWPVIRSRLIRYKACRIEEIPEQLLTGEGSGIFNFRFPSGFKAFFAVNAESWDELVHFGTILRILY